LCLVNQGYLCIGTSTRGAAGHPAREQGIPVWADRGPSNALIEKDSKAWLETIQKSVHAHDNVPDDELREALLSPTASAVPVQFSDYAGEDKAPRSKDKVL
jgi:hypothetical protein